VIVVDASAAVTAVLVAIKKFVTLPSFTIAEAFIHDHQGGSLGD
jgi:hypothetical protein